MSVFETVVGAVRIISVDRGGVGSRCQLLALFLSNGTFYQPRGEIIELLLLLSHWFVSKCDCERSSLRLP